MNYDRKLDFLFHIQDNLKKSMNKNSQTNLDKYD